MNEGQNTGRNKRMEETLKIKKYNKIQTKRKELGTSAKGLNCATLIA